MLKLKLLFVVAAVSCTSLAQTPAKTEAEDASVQVSVGSKSSTSVFNLLDFGLIAVKTSTKTEIEIKNTAPKDLTLDAFTIGENARAVWKSPDPETGLLTRNTIRSGASSSLVVDILFDDGPLPQIVLSDRGSVVTSVAIDFQPAENPIVRKAQLSGLSAYGGGMGGWYEGCVGAAPPGYALDKSSVKYFIATGANNEHDRHCGYYADCETLQADDSDVCMRWRARGHYKGGGLGRNPENQTLYIYGTLSASYFLIDPAPNLVALTALRKADALKASQGSTQP